MAMGPYLSIITLNVIIYAPTKRQRLPEWIQKQDPYICCLQKTHFKTGDTYRLTEKYISCKRGPKESRSNNTDITILISDKIDFQIKAVERDKEGHT